MTKVDIRTATGVDASLEVITKPSKKDPEKTWTALFIKVGEWSTLVFPKSRFEMDYIQKQLEGEE